MKESTAIFLRGVYKKLVHPPQEPAYDLPCLKEKDAIQELIKQCVLSDEPKMVSRFGSIELTSLENAKNIREGKSIWRYITWQGEPNYLKRNQAEALCNNAGFFPLPDEKMMIQFLSEYESAMKEIDILGSWRYNEAIFKKELSKSIKVDRELMTPLLCDHPWTEALADKRVLVVHPFASTIEKQYERRELLFPGTNILPDFHLITFKSVQSQALSPTKFENWFEALDWQKEQIEMIDYDICLLACGAYGMPLAAHCKRNGKKAIHLGGILQLLFGIKGKRWETEKQYIEDFPYTNYYNDAWVRPSFEETPMGAERVEGGCYW